MRPRTNLLTTLSTWVTARRTIALLAAWLLFQVAFGAMAATAPAGGKGPPDLLFLATPAQLLACLEALGEEGRAVYLRLFLVDTIYPLVYAALLAGCIVLGARAHGRAAMGARLAMIPFGAAVFDWSENVSFLALISRWPRSPPALVQAACLFNSAKWGLAGLSLLLALGALGALLVKRR